MKKMRNTIGVTQNEILDLGSFWVFPFFIPNGLLCVFHVISFRGSCIMHEVQRADGLIRTESFTFAQFDTIQQKGLQLN